MEFSFEIIQKVIKASHRLHTYTQTYLTKMRDQIRNETGKSKKEINGGELNRE